MQGKYNDISDSPKKGTTQDTPAAGRQRREGHPNGGEVARVDVPRSKMPQNQSSTPLQSSPLNTDLGKMPKQMSGPQQRDPRRR